MLQIADLRQNLQAQRSKDTVPVIQRAERAILLTGTPALARPKELFNQISALLPAAKLKMKDYGERYCAGGNSKFDKYCGRDLNSADPLRMTLETTENVSNGEHRIA